MGGLLAFTHIHIAHMLTTIRNQLTLQMDRSIIVKCYFQIVTAKDFSVTAVTQSNSQNYQKKNTFAETSKS